MAPRKLASILIRDDRTCVKAASVSYPLWKPETHLNYMLAADYSDLIIASDNSRTLLKLNTGCYINMIAALGWSGVWQIIDLFEAGYSKIFFGGVDRRLPSIEEAEYFSEMVRIYGASSFGYSLHFDEVVSDPDPAFLAQFNEVLLIPHELQLYIDKEKSRKLAKAFESCFRMQSHEINLCAPSANHQAWSLAAAYPVNFVNYCEHAIAGLR